MPTLWYLWGHNKAILSGNVMHALAYKTASTLMEKGISNEKALRTSQLLSESSLSMIQGQCLDLNFEKVIEVSVEQYLEMIKLFFFKIAAARLACWFARLERTIGVPLVRYFSSRPKSFLS